MGAHRPFAFADEGCGWEDRGGLVGRADSGECRARCVAAEGKGGVVLRAPRSHSRVARHLE
eukprot:3889413-Prymnesium_polylepis.1